jgi:hypothetical protein
MVIEGLFLDSREEINVLFANPVYLADAGMIRKHTKTWIRSISLFVDILHTKIKNHNV